MNKPLYRINNFMVESKKRYQGFIVSLQASMLMIFSVVLKACLGSNFDSVDSDSKSHFINTYPSKDKPLLRNSASNISTKTNIIDSSISSIDIINDDIIYEDNQGKSVFNDKEFDGVSLSKIDLINSANKNESNNAWKSNDFEGQAAEQKNFKAIKELDPTNKNESNNAWKSNDFEGRVAEWEEFKVTKELDPANKNESSNTWKSNDFEGRVAEWEEFKIAKNHKINSVGYSKKLEDISQSREKIWKIYSSIPFNLLDSDDYAIIDCDGKKDISGVRSQAFANKKFFIFKNINLIKNFVGSIMREFAECLAKCSDFLKTKPLKDVVMEAEFFAKIKLFTCDEELYKSKDINQSICKLLEKNMDEVYTLLLKKDSLNSLGDEEFLSKECYQKLLDIMTQCNLDWAKFSVSSYVNTKEVINEGLYSYLIKYFKDTLQEKIGHDLSLSNSFAKKGDYIDIDYGNSIYVDIIVMAGNNQSFEIG